MFSLDYPSGWYLMLILGILFFSLLSYIRKSTAGAFRFGFIGLLFSIIVELVGVGTNLWNYIGGNWPVIIWPCYVLLYMIIYQMAKVAKQEKLL